MSKINSPDRLSPKSNLLGTTNNLLLLQKMEELDRDLLPFIKRLSQSIIGFFNPYLINYGVQKISLINLTIPNSSHGTSKTF